MRNHNEKLQKELKENYKAKFSLCEGNFDSINNWIEKNMFYADVFKYDIYEDINERDYIDLLIATTDLFLYVAIIDNLIDSSSLEAKNRFMLGWDLLDLSKNRLQGLLYKYKDNRNFEDSWRILLKTSFISNYNRQNGRLKKEDCWKLSAFLLIIPYSLLSFNEKRVPIIFESNSEVFSSNTALNNWINLFRHCFNAKQSIDDLLDFAIDLQNNTPTRMVSMLLGIKPTSDFSRNIISIINQEYSYAIEELVKAKDISVNMLALNWTKLLDDWINELNQNR